MRKKEIDSDAIRVIICDDHPTTAMGVAAGLETEPDIVVVGMAKDVERVLELVKEKLPDIVLLDIYIGKTNGIEAIRPIRAASPSTQVVMFTMSDDNKHLLKAAKAGATGYIMKDKDAAEIATILRDIFQGHSSLPSSLAGGLIKELNEKHDLMTDLSDQERDIFLGLAQGETDAELAARLAISKATVRRKLLDVRIKFSLADRKEVARFAIKHGLDQEP